MFQVCLNNCLQRPFLSQNADLSIRYPEPLKFRLAKSLNLLDPLLKKFLLPRRKQQYKFSRKNLYFLETQTNSIPFIYTKSINPSRSVLFIYCHGSGSTLNHVYEFTNCISSKFGIASIAYDYTGDGQSENDLKCILGWAVKQGYELRKIILCGFSLGSYSALCLKGQMSRILISPICGITSYIQQRAINFEGEIFDNIEKALQLRSRVWITHCKKQLIPIEHSQILRDALLKNNPQSQIRLTEISSGYDHKSAPSFLFSKQGSDIMSKFVLKILNINQTLTEDTKELKVQLLQICKNIKIKSAQQQPTKKGQ